MQKINDIVGLYVDIKYKLLTDSPAYTVGYIHAIRDEVDRQKTYGLNPFKMQC